MYTDGPARVLVCKCGGRSFTVGLDNYFTAVRCEACGFEECIHEG